MNVLGVSAFFHDSACCLLQDGILVAAAQEERFSRVRGDARLPVHAYKYCLEEGGLTPSDLDVVAFYEITTDRWARQAESGSSRTPQADPVRLIGRRFGFSGPILSFPHHTSHAASAFLFSPFERAAVFTADGVGEWTTTAYWTGDGADLRMLDEVRFPHSIGLFYAALTAWLGFEVNGGEGTVMALAALGRPTMVGALRELIRSEPGPSFVVEPKYFGFPNTMFTPALFEALGIPPRPPGSEISTDHKNLAASLQVVTEELLIEKLAYLHETTGEDHLCLAGGVALNCVANSRIARESGFAELFIQPAAGDAGGALGAAALAAVALGESRPRGLETPLFGPAFDPRPFLAGTSLEARDFGDDEAGLITAVVDLLEAGSVVGWFQGRMEFGPRALGARSILADPRSTTTRDHINRMVKNREWFRPFGVSVREERAETCLGGSVVSPHMLATCSVREDLQAVSHVDGSTRPQLVNRRSSGRFWRLLEEWEKRTGCPGLLNTSFNGRGEPIVCTPTDALLTAAACRLDALVLEDVVIDCLPAAWQDLVSAWRGPSKSSARPNLYTF